MRLRFRLSSRYRVLPLIWTTYQNFIVVLKVLDTIMVGKRADSDNSVIDRDSASQGQDKAAFSDAQSGVKFVRLLPAAEIPRYTHIPGSGTPHPYRDPRGHSYNKRPQSPKGLKEHQWAENRSYLMALDYFNLGFYWEAHDEWERLLRTSGADSICGLFVKGLVKMAAAGIKVREESIHGVRRHAASAGEVFADVAAESDQDRFCGLSFTLLQFAADRAAQLAYPTALEAGRPLRVFPFLLIPEPVPLV